MRRAAIVVLSIVCFVALVRVALWAAAPAGEAVEKGITVDGKARKYLVYVPQRAAGKAEPAPPAAGWPVVLAFHGGGGNARQMERYSRFNATAAAGGFVVIYPEALDASWNDGRGAANIKSQKNNVDDVKFVRAVVDQAATELKLDRSRIFATGISNGAFISHRLATEASDLIAGIAPVVGGMAPAMAEKFQPAHPVSILLIQGDADPLVPIAGGEVSVLGSKRGQATPTDQTLALYVKRNGNAGEPVTTTQDDNAQDGTSVELRKYADGIGGAKTYYYLIKNGGHTWPGRPLYLPEGVIGKASQEFNASEVIWEFFRSCPPRTAR